MENKLLVIGYFLLVCKEMVLLPIAETD